MSTPDFGDPTTEGTISYTEWVEAPRDRALTPGTWIPIESGGVIGIREQWVP